MRFLYRKKISFIQNFLNKAVFKKELTFQQLLCGIVIDSGIVAKLLSKFSSHDISKKMWDVNHNRAHKIALKSVANLLLKLWNICSKLFLNNLKRH